jgi:hypothetical protein
MATFDTTGIIKLFSNNKFRLIALTLVLVFLGLMTFFNVYYKTDDCKPLIEQNKMLMDQNTLVIKRNSELVEGFRLGIFFQDSNKSNYQLGYERN